MRLQACPRALRVMTWNLWDMSLITPHHNARVAGMCRALEDNVDNIDIVGLQECWCETTRVRLIAAAERGGLKHHHAFVSGVDLPLGVRGPGLMVLSRFPIVDVAFVRWVRGALVLAVLATGPTSRQPRYCVNGHPWRFDHMDYQAGKGIGYVQILTPMVCVALVACEYTVGSVCGALTESLHPAGPCGRVHFTHYCTGALIPGHARPGALLAPLTWGVACVRSTRTTIDTLPIVLPRLSRAHSLFG